jgi:DNA-binding MarR family transcriptional regulator
MVQATVRTDAPTGGTPGTSSRVAEVAAALRDAVVLLRRSMHGRPEDGAPASLLGSLLRIGPVRATDLAERTCLDRSTVSRHLRQLEESGYVERRPDPDDGRAALLHVSPAGREHAAAHFAATVATLETALSAWPAADIDTLTTLLRRLADDLETS